MMNLLPPTGNLTISTDLLNNTLFGKRDVTVSMLRLDTIHPVVSGNKIFKLYYFLEDTLRSSHKQIITFGGAYSNHLAATAFTCKEIKIKCVGIVRGEAPAALSPTLLFCIQNGMRLEFMSRASYQKINDEEFRHDLFKKYGDHTLIPEGGYSQKGANGAKLIADHYNSKSFTHICCAIGTATTFAGLITGSKDEATITGISVLKNLNDIDARLKDLKVDAKKKYLFNGNYHFGGYAKRTPELIAFMNSFYKDNKIPLDFVYTGKMMFGVYDLVNKNYFPPGSRILCIHTGGVQGNQSLPQGMLSF